MSLHGRVRSHRFGTRSPFWFTRVWEGFEIEAEAEAAAQAALKDVPISQAAPETLISEGWEYGQTSVIKNQAARTIVLRVLVVRTAPPSIPLAARTSVGCSISLY